VLSLPGNLVRALRSDADWLIGIKPFPNVTVPLLLARWLRGKRIVVDVDDLDFGYFRGWRAALIRALETPAPRRFDVVTYHNERLKDVLIRRFRVPPDRVLRLEQGVDLDVFRPRPIPVEEGTLLYVGHLNIASDLAFILQAVAYVQRSRRARFTVAGGGPCAGRFREMADELGVVTRFTGPLSNHEVADEIAKAEVCLVYYADTEVNRYRCSMKLRECLAMGKKTVCNDVGELGDFAPFTYASSSRLEDFADRIVEALDGGDSREERGATFVRERYDWNRIAAGFGERLRGA
jgi:glycosyltransferase involved in cell wall biosynthesis